MFVRPPKQTKCFHRFVLNPEFLMWIHLEQQTSIICEIRVYSQIKSRLSSGPFVSQLTFKRHMKRWNEADLKRKFSLTFSSLFLCEAAFVPKSRRLKSALNGFYFWRTYRTSCVKKGNKAENKGKQGAQQQVKSRLSRNQLLDEQTKEELHPHHHHPSWGWWWWWVSARGCEGTRIISPLITLISESLSLQVGLWAGTQQVRGLWGAAGGLLSTGWIPISWEARGGQRIKGSLLRLWKHFEIWIIPSNRDF